MKDCFFSTGEQDEEVSTVFFSPDGTRWKFCGNKENKFRKCFEVTSRWFALRFALIQLQPFSTLLEIIENEC